MKSKNQENTEKSNNTKTENRNNAEQPTENTYTGEFGKIIDQSISEKRYKWNLVNSSNIGIFHHKIFDIVTNILQDILLSGVPFTTQLEIAPKDGLVKTSSIEDIRKNLDYDLFHYSKFLATCRGIDQCVIFWAYESLTTI